MAEHRPHPPTDSKLQGLRANGIFPRADALSAFFSLFGLLFGLGLAWRTNSDRYFNFARDAFGRAGLNETQALASALNIAGTLSAFFLVPLLLVVILGGLWQSKFLIAPSLLRSKRIDRSFETAEGRRWSSAFLTAANFLLWLLIGAAIVWYSGELIRSNSAVGIADFRKTLSTAEIGNLPSALTELDEQLLRSASSELEQYRRFLLIILAISLFIGIASRIRAVLAFFRYHHMSRSELEAEVRETELPASVKDAQRESREID